jgi:hypothetical protein
VLRTALLITLGLAVVPRPAAAQSCGDADALRAELEREARRVSTWNWSWRIGFTALAVGQAAIAVSGSVSDDNTRGLWLGSARSALGALGQWISPLRIEVPPATGDACADRTALRAAAERAARDERQAFWVSHLGGLAINIGGAAVLAGLTSWRNGLLSFATGYPVGLLSTYTMPRASWHRTRAAAWTAGITASDGTYGFVVAGGF